MEVKTKFQLGDTVWAIKNNKAIHFEIKSISYCISISDECGYCYYNSDETGVAIGYSVSEDKCFGSKDELIKAIFDDETN